VEHHVRCFWVAQAAICGLSSANATQYYYHSKCISLNMIDETSASSHMGPAARWVAIRSLREPIEGADKGGSQVTQCM
jgi:hypothetical protein